MMCSRVEMGCECPTCGYPQSEARYILDEGTGLVHDVCMMTVVCVDPGCEVEKRCENLDYDNDMFTHYDGEGMVEEAFCETA